MSAVESAAALVLMATLASTNARAGVQVARDQVFTPAQIIVLEEKRDACLDRLDEIDALKQDGMTDQEIGRMKVMSLNKCNDIVPETK